MDRLVVNTIHTQVVSLLDQLVNSKPDSLWETIETLKALKRMFPDEFKEYQRHMKVATTERLMYAAFTDSKETGT